MAKSAAQNYLSQELSHSDHVKYLTSGLLRTYSVGLYECFSMGIRKIQKNKQIKIRN